MKSFKLKMQKSSKLPMKVRRIIHKYTPISHLNMNHRNREVQRTLH